jgi:hypothetical protein
MNPPHVYAEWLTVLDRFRSGDDAVLELMRAGSIEWTNVVAERWTRQVTDTLTVRLQALERQLQTNLDRARGDYLAISNGLLAARRGLSPLYAFADLACLPPDVRALLLNDIERWATSKQQSLEQQGERTRHDQGRFLKTVRDHPLTAAAAPPAPPARTAEPVPPVRGRRVIF